MFIPLSFSKQAPKVQQDLVKFILKGVFEDIDSLHLNEAHIFFSLYLVLLPTKLIFKKKVKIPLESFEVKLEFDSLQT